MSTAINKYRYAHHSVHITQPYTSIAGIWLELTHGVHGSEHVKVINVCVSMGV